MADETAAEKGRGGLLRSLMIGAPLALLGAGGGFYAVWSGVVPLPGEGAGAHAEAAPPGDDGHGAGAAHGAADDGRGETAAHGEAAAHGAPAADGHGEAPAAGGGVFVPLAPIIVTVGAGDAARHLQFAAQLEVAPGAGPDVAAAMPRALDVLTTYLRAVAPSDIDDPSAMLRMRAQMLRRVQVVMGEGKVRDLLVAEFVMR